jgi:hypothetical protein
VHTSPVLYKAYIQYFLRKGIPRFTWLFSRSKWVLMKIITSEKYIKLYVCPITNFVLMSVFKFRTFTASMQFIFPITGEIRALYAHLLNIDDGKSFNTNNTSRLQTGAWYTGTLLHTNRPVVINLKDSTCFAQTGQTCKQPTKPTEFS